MKKLAPALLLLSLFLVNCQHKNNIKIDNMSFLVGTLNDYMGREMYTSIEERVDEYLKSDSLLALFIDSIFKKTYPDLTFEVAENSGRLELYSKLLAEKINEYYSYKPSGRLFYHGETIYDTLKIDSLVKTKNFYENNFDTIYTGSIKKEIFTDNLKKLSFIIGVYARFGDKNDSTYSVTIYNSISKAKVFAELLKEMNCTNVEYDRIKRIPVNHIVYFTPTDELKEYLEEIKQSI